MTDINELLWHHAIEAEDFEEADKLSRQVRLDKIRADLSERGVTLCSFDERDPISGKRCILLDNHGGSGHRVDTPLLDSDQWNQPEWMEYEAVFGRHVTPSE